MSSSVQVEEASGVGSILSVTRGALGNDQSAEGFDRQSIAPLVTNKLANSLAAALADRFSRMIVVSAIAEGKTIYEISVEQDIPLSTCYRRVRRLVDTGVLLLERIVLSPAGSKCGVYRSAFRAVSMKLENGRFSTEVTVNPAVADKLYDRWLATKWKR